MRKWISIPLAACAITFGSVAVETVAPVEAALTNCYKGTNGTNAWAFCTSSTSNPPYTTQVVVVADCVRPWWAGGGSYQAVGNWASKGQTSNLWCANYYKPQNLRLWFR